MDAARTIIILILLVVLTSSVMPQSKEVVAYFPEWGVNYKPYYVKHIETSGSAEIITVINYSFGIPTPDSTGNIGVSFQYPEYAYAQIYDREMSIDGIADDSTQAVRGHFNQFRKLKQKYPHIRIVVSLGGWLGSVYFSDAALTKESREYFVDACINLFIHGDLPLLNGAGGEGVAPGIFDGIDIDWEYPISGGPPGIRHNENDNDNLTELFKLFRSELDKINPDYLLTAALPAPSGVLKNYNVTEDTEYLNWYLLMTYDFYGGWTPNTGHHTNLLVSDYEAVPGRRLSMHATVMKFMKEYEVPKDQIIPGVAFYGRGWKNVDAENYGFANKGGISDGIYEAGHNYYSDLIKLKSKGYKLHWDETALAHWLYNDNDKIMWTLDDPQTLALKAQYVDAYDLRGIMFWDLNGDDSVGTLIKTLAARNVPDVTFKKINSENINTDISIARPGNSSIVIEGSNVIIDTEIDGDINSIVKVEFFVDDKSIGYDTEPPFNWAWFNTAEGNHSIRIEAINISGTVVTDSVQIKVRN